VALDLSAVRLSPNGIAHLVANLAERNIRVLGIEGVESIDTIAGLPPLLRGGRGTQDLGSQDLGRQDLDLPAPEPTPVADSVPARREQPSSLLIEEPVRSGQSVAFVEGDVTVLGSVGSGAEIIAGGSIHVYGTLRGQAMAGVTGSRRARIFCHRFEAELLAIGSYYKTADEIDDSVRSGPIQAWLDGNTLKISAMN
jgi:septum site-determining protein MinC